VPNLVFFIDDSLDYIEKIDTALASKAYRKQRSPRETQADIIWISLYIAKRYILSNSKNNAINIINRIASMGIIVGAMALFVVLSVLAG
jgi:hypothetical protein